MKGKSITVLTLILLTTFTGVMGYTINYILNQTTSHTITVGENSITEYGLEVTLLEYDDYNLIYHDLPENETDKHYISYTFNYTILLTGYDISVSSVTDDIVISDIVYGETIIITFGLNQDKEFTSGQEITIQFNFALEEITLNEYTASNPLNINRASVEELQAIGFTLNEANNTVAASNGGISPYSDLENLAYRTGSPTLVDRYGEYEVAGIIVFN